MKETHRGSNVVREAPLALFAGILEGLLQRKYDESREVVTYRELSADSGIPASTWRDWLSGSSKPSPQNREALCRFLEISPNELCSIENLEIDLASLSDRSHTIAK